MSVDVQQIRDALVIGHVLADAEDAHDTANDFHAALALLDGVTGLAREGDVVLSAEQAQEIDTVLRDWGLQPATACRSALAAGRTGTEQT